MGDHRGRPDDFARLHRRANHHSVVNDHLPQSMKDPSALNHQDGILNWGRAGVIYQGVLTTASPYNGQPASKSWTKVYLYFITMTVRAAGSVPRSIVTVCSTSLTVAVLPIALTKSSTGANTFAKDADRSAVL
jgi:uncharacterized protein involved in response to NO